MRSISFDQIADEYDESRGGTKRGEVMADVLESHLDRSGLVGEIGIGTAIVASALASRGFDVVGVDLAPAMLHRANTRLPGRVATADAAQLPYDTGRLSSAFMVWVLHVVGDPVAVLRECVRVVQPGGRVAVVPAHSWSDETDPMEQHLSRLAVLRPALPTLGDIDGWMRAAGFVDIEIRYNEDQSMIAPADAAGDLERRVWSSLWDLDDDRFAEIVQPVIDGLLSLPDPGVPRPRRHRNHVIVGTAPLD